MTHRNKLRARAKEPPSKQQWNEYLQKKKKKKRRGNIYIYIYACRSPAETPTDGFGIEPRPIKQTVPYSLSLTSVSGPVLLLLRLLVGLMSHSTQERRNPTLAPSSRLHTCIRRDPFDGSDQFGTGFSDGVHALCKSSPSATFSSAPPSSSSHGGASGAAAASSCWYFSTVSTTSIPSPASIDECNFVTDET